MDLLDSALAPMRDPRLAAHAFAETPAWLWRADGGAAFWSNVVGATVFGEASPGALTARRFAPDHPARRELVRLAGILPTAGTTQFARLRGFGSALQGAMPARCSRLRTAEGQSAILIAGTEPVRPSLSLPDRVGRLLGDMPGTGESAAFSRDGVLLWSGGPAAAQRLAGAARPRELQLLWEAASADRPVQVLLSGSVVRLERLGPDETGIVLATFIQDENSGGEEARRPAALARAPARTGAPESDRQADRAEPPPVRPSLNLVSNPPNVVSLRLAAVERRPALSALEHTAFEEIARALTVRSHNVEPTARHEPVERTGDAEPAFPPGATLASIKRQLAAAWENQGGPIRPEPIAAAEASPSRQIVPAPAGDAPPTPGARTSESDDARSVAASTQAGSFPIEAMALAGSAAISEQAIEVARQETAALRSLLEAAGDGVMILDGQHRILRASSAAEHLFEQPPGGLIENRLEALLAPASRNPARRTLERLEGAAEPGLVVDCDVMGRRREGSQVALKLAAAGLTATPTQICVVVRNLDPMLRLKGELALEQRRSKEAAAARTDLLLRLADELRGPMEALLAQAAGVQTCRLKDAQDAHWAPAAEAVARQALATVADLSELANVEADRRRALVASVDLNAAVAEAVCAKHADAARRRAVIRTALSSTTPDIQADRAGLTRILALLLAHAIHACGPGGQVIVSTAETTGEAVLRVRGAALVVGSGGARSDAAAAGQPAPERMRIGAGLSLPLAQALAHANGARLRIHKGDRGDGLVELAFPRSWPQPETRATTDRA